MTAPDPNPRQAAWLAEITLYAGRGDSDAVAEMVRQASRLGTLQEAAAALAHQAAELLKALRPGDWEDGLERVRETLEAVARDDEVSALNRLFDES